jgi:hypothetical protein
MLSDYLYVPMRLPSDISTQFAIFIIYMSLGFAYFFVSGFLRGKKQDMFYQSKPFLILSRLYCFSLWWVWVYWFSFPLSMLYLLYLPFYLDLGEFTGSRLSESVRRSALGRVCKKIFGSQLIKTVDIDCQCVIGIHHHGLLPFGSVTAIGTEACDFSSLFPHLSDRVLVAASYCFMVPFFRDFILAGSVVDCNKWSMEAWLKRGYTVAVYPGGAREGFYATPHADILDLKRKKGFLRLAMRCGVPVVPAYSFNEVDHYHTVRARPGTAQCTVSYRVSYHLYKYTHRITYPTYHALSCGVWLINVAITI